MYYERDWIMRQIQMAIQLIAKLVLKNDFLQYEIKDEANLSRADLLYQQLAKLLDELKICDAEDLLFSSFDNSREYLMLAIDFYNRLNGFSDDALENNNFSREEINEGLNEIIRRHGITLPSV